MITFAPTKCVHVNFGTIQRRRWPCEVEAARSIATAMLSVAARLALRAHAMVSENDETWFEVGEAVLNVLAQCRLGNQVVTHSPITSPRRRV
jgi:hypothetical protein